MRAQVRFFVPDDVQVAAFVVFQEPQLWPMAAIVWVSTWLEFFEQTRFFDPLAVHVAALVVVHAPQLCALLVAFPQTEQTALHVSWVWVAYH